MGRLTTEPEKETPTTTIITHFSHPHPLKLISIDHQQQQQTLISSSCLGCDLNLSGTIYSCTICKDFFLHKKCFDMPKKITHPFHKDHTLTLLPKPAYSTGVFNCDACFETGKGFSYSCEPCEIDLHILCASMPLSVTNTTCHPHKLDLSFGSPYETKNFTCDVCKKIGGDHWLYRCGACEFDAHLKCARSRNYNRSASFHGGSTTTRSVHVPQPQPPHVQQSFAHHPSYYQYHNMNPHAVHAGYPAGGSVAAVDTHNQMLLQAIQQMIQDNQAMTQAIHSGGLGGGVGGGARGVQQLTRLMSRLNNIGGVPGGTGDTLQMLMNGGGGGDIFQSLLVGNGLDFLGGGGLDFLGGGGLDFLGGGDSDSLGGGDSDFLGGGDSDFGGGGFDFF